ncbi:hypothetical protein B0H15DRAFT_830316 [Mycena belliarum]|uniref:Uncharacterized protein n=1 Tax=Mycena belliarum TaxID=1033014 RepID=A0AAD6U8Z9_9AGAR|nr:hypothetical protein B0H15DRAFT_830316 [Mycena belliae]
MDLPSPRELELEALLRQRDTQVSELGNEVTRLRQYLITQPAPAPTDPVSLPPALSSLLLPHLDPAPKSAASTSSAAALTQRTRLLQEENDELYQLLRQSETGKLKEEVRGLRRLVERLEGALRESHQVVVSLSTELDKSYEAILTTAPRATNDKPHPRSPRNSYHGPPSTGNGNSASKLPPTGPRAHKKPRLSDSHASPPPAALPHRPANSTSNSTASSSRPDGRARDSSPRHAPEHRGKANSRDHARMDVDEPRAPARSPTERDKDKDLRHRDRQRRDERERERDRDGGRRDRRNGNGGRGGGGRRADRGPPPPNNNNTYPGGDRTLKERLGL